MRGAGDGEAGGAGDGAAAVTDGGAWLAVRSADCTRFDTREDPHLDIAFAPPRGGWRRRGADLRKLKDHSQGAILVIQNSTTV
ncbi:hypothetical protein Shyd_54170 [Streptomyces hydrogenans]|uniref:Uncharacterized protein n=1 Tax=Streptomyces hydrogenans TaxID=1873719 RepID=A0ABQ3PG97_9ACTN|nr:hypothetical protein GCM10018784_03950 [Streptomyces hydrogenans]GHI24046.1 hypothetical protein Shyd_54170 [Streptomyces hydrogenans]